jgi:hypothetical protein
MTINPYSSPSLETPSFDATPSAATNLTLVDIVKTTFLAWERLRIAYVLLLGLLTVVLVGPQPIHVAIVIVIAGGAVLANLCYFAGPILESYVRWLGYQGKGLRWFLFIGGTLLTAILEIALLGPSLLPNQN